MTYSPRLAIRAIALVAAVFSSACAAADTDSTTNTAAATPASAQQQRIDQIIATLGKVQRFDAVAISPDGRRLAWTAHGKTGTRLVLADVDGRHPGPVGISGASASCEDSEPRWSPDGSQLAFLSTCGAAGGDQAQVFLVGAQGGPAKQLGTLKGYAHGLQWAPDGASLGFLYVAGDNHRVGATAAIKPRTGVIGPAEAVHQRIATLALNDAAISEVTPADLFVYEFGWSADAHRVTYTAAPAPGENNWWVARLYAQTLGQAPVQVLDPASVAGPLHGLQIAVPRFSPDGSRIALIGGLMSDQGATGGDLYLVPADGGAPVDVTPGITTTPSWFTWLDDQSLLVSAFKGGSAQVSRMDLAAGAKAKQQPLFDVDAGISDGSMASALSIDRAHERVAYLHSSFTQAPEVHVARLRVQHGVPTGLAQAPHAVTNANSQVQPLWGRQESVRWTSDGFDVQGWLLLPPNYDPHKKYPLIVYVHGGPAYATRPAWPGVGYGPVPLAAMGYFVLMPNPRGSYGQGAKFSQANRRDFGYGDLRDILAGVDAVEAKYPIDDKRLGLTGWSYGGFMSMFAPTQTRRFAAVVAGAGLSNWQSYYGENSIDQWMIPFFGASVYDDPAVYAKSSAINYIKNAKSPTLILVGELDGETPAPQSFEYWHALQAMGTPTELVVYPGEGHGFRDPAHRRDTLERALGWFGRYLGGGQ